MNTDTPSTTTSTIVSEPCVMVVFGASGDLTRRKLVPALYHLVKQGGIPSEFSLVGNANSQMSRDEFQLRLKGGVRDFSGDAPFDSRAWQRLEAGLFYLPGDFGDPGNYIRLAELLAQVDRERETRSNRLFYLATPPSLHGGIIRGLSSAGLARNPLGWTRIVVEKPFGRDLASARALNRELLKVFEEPQVFRIDHYLGKETVQNILVSRFSNGIFEAIWNRRYIDHVQITVAEDLGIEHRARYYEESGALRDMLQLLALTAMEPPVCFAADTVRDEKVKSLKSLRPLSEEKVRHCVVRGQYSKGIVRGSHVPGYRDELEVSPDSVTETYVAAELRVENWRWSGVPFYLRTGKRLPTRLTEIRLHFKQPPIRLFEQIGGCGDIPTSLTVHIQPTEGLSLHFGAKEPGPGICVKPVSMEFSYPGAFGVGTEDAYQRLLFDCMLGDATLFARRDGVEASWSVVQPILDYWDAASPETISPYPAGTWGPVESDGLLQRSGRAWVRPDIP